MSFTLTNGKLSSAGITISSSSIMTCKGDLRVQGDLFIGGTLTLNERTLTGADVEDFIDQNTTEKRLRDRYPTVQSAWESYQLALKLCRSETNNNNDL